MKLLGFGMIIISGIFCAVFYNESRLERIRELDAICFMLEFMQAELVCKMSPLPLIFRNMARIAKDKSFEFAKVIEASLEKLGAEDFASIWQSCCERCFTHLKENELESMLRLSSVLGKYDVESQTAAINECLQCLKNSSALDASCYPEFKRLSIGLSLSVACLFAIMIF